MCIVCSTRINIHVYVLVLILFAYYLPSLYLRENFYNIRIAFFALNKYCMEWFCAGFVVVSTLFHTVSPRCSFYSLHFTFDTSTSHNHTHNAKVRWTTSISCYFLLNHFYICIVSITVFTTHCCVSFGNLVLHNLTCFFTLDFVRYYCWALIVRWPDFSAWLDQHSMCIWEHIGGWDMATLRTLSQSDLVFSLFFLPFVQISSIKCVQFSMPPFSIFGGTILVFRPSITFKISAKSVVMMMMMMMNVFKFSITKSNRYTNTRNLVDNWAMKWNHQPMIHFLFLLLHCIQEHCNLSS